MRFVKYHGLGNDFILIDVPPAEPVSLTPARARAWCARGAGVGADGLMRAAAPPEGAEADVAMELLNADGSTPEMCGNGIRCLVKYVVERLGLDANPLRVWTPGGVRACAWSRDGAGAVDRVRVDMGPPRFDRRSIPMTGTGEAVEITVAADGRDFTATGVHTGNPHMVIFSEGHAAAAARWGPALSRHAWWPQGANVEFATVAGPNTFDVAVYERGCGLTQACGTGATAVAAAAVRLGRADPDAPIAIRLPGGALSVTIERGFRTAWMEGPAVEVYRGTIAEPPAA